MKKRESMLHGKWAMRRSRHFTDPDSPAQFIIQPYFDHVALPDQNKAGPSF
ncbi:hypothetical protein [Sphingobacterium kitahiroshimense]|uniref:Uncharacterized protein n=1 Tax=Sphingobacterium kitahiroshimense TaxID=470446 RepID=A0ABV0BVT5_9SPHI